MGLYLIKKNFHEIIDIADLADRYNYQNGTASNYKVLFYWNKVSNLDVHSILETVNKKNTHIKKPRCLFYFYKMYQHYDYEHFIDIDITEQEQETLLKHCQKTLRHWLEDSMMMV